MHVKIKQARFGYIGRFGNCAAALRPSGFAEQQRTFPIGTGPTSFDQGNYQVGGNPMTQCFRIPQATLAAAVVDGQTDTSVWDLLIAVKDVLSSRL